MSQPRFWSTPLRYLRWASHERPAYFYSMLIGACGPVALVTLPPIRRFLGDVDPAPIPLSYPSMYHARPSGLTNTRGTKPGRSSLTSRVSIVPPGPRKIPEGYDDE